MNDQPEEKRQDWIRGRREKRKLARMARTRRQILRYTLLLVMVALGICGFSQLRWSINNLENDVWIQGNKVVSDEQVRDALKGTLHRAVYRLDPAKLSADVCKLPAVRHAFVRRYILPRPHIRVEVLEEFPWATYSSSPEAAPEGVIAETGRFIPLDRFPSVVQPPFRVCGDKALKLAASEIWEWDSWARLIEAQTGQPVMLVDLRVMSAVQAFSGGYELHLGSLDSTLNRRLGRLSSVMPVVANLREDLKFIDLSLDSNIPLKVDKSSASSARHADHDLTQPPAETADTGTPMPM